MALVSLGWKSKGGGGWGGGALEGCAAPPSSCELGCNEMETLRGLPGSGPALCSRERVANGGVAFFFPGTWQQQQQHSRLY